MRTKVKPRFPSVRSSQTRLAGWEYPRQLGAWKRGGTTSSGQKEEAEPGRYQHVGPYSSVGLHHTGHAAHTHTHKQDHENDPKFGSLTEDTEMESTSLAENPHLPPTDRHQPAAVPASLVLVPCLAGS